MLCCYRSAQIILAAGFIQICLIFLIVLEELEVFPGHMRFMISCASFWVFYLWMEGS